MENELLYDKVIELIDRNEKLYDRWENQIASCIAKKWIEAFNVAKEISGSENPTLTEIADMGTDAIHDSKEFLRDIDDIFWRLSKGAELNNDGGWC
jgi:hypothetical protein